MFLKGIVLLVGFVCLIKGADYFVDRSAALAAIFRVPGLVIGLTIVAAGVFAWWMENGPERKKDHKEDK